MYSSEILMCINVLPYLLGKYLLPITTNTIQTFIHKFMEKGISQQSNNNLKIYKKNSVHTFDIHTRCQ
jgi:hypothetical protein